ncbi:glycerophosphodiester phosphodiesterase [Kineococcus gynurae]|uniref:Glycerophosphodiester phosphodiesterase n=1 Tax=Kineococcus gynurae TaxID=452979 RepID=A0ABV5LSD2_9ACTN
MRKPLVVAHRGYSVVAPENTLAAVESALRVGADLVEIDVQLTADGVPVVLHDQRLDATTSGSGEISQVSTTTVFGLDAGSWFSPAFSGQPLPLFADVVDLLAAHHRGGLLVELKGTWSVPAAAGLVDTVREAGIEQRCSIQGFDPRSVAAVGDVAPDLRRGLLLMRPGPDTAAEGEALRRDLGISFVAPHAGAALEPDVVAGYHRAGLDVAVWTVDEPALWRALVRNRVDAIITNRPGELLGHLAARELALTQDAPVPDADALHRLAAAQGLRAVGTRRGVA